MDPKIYLKAPIYTKFKFENFFVTPLEKILDPPPD